MSRPHPSEPVLVVDDESEVRSSVRTTLLLAGITNVEECEDGDKADAFIRAHSLAAVILDLMMPGLSGIDLLSLILEQRPETPVIVATGTGDLETAVRCMRAGAFDYLAKPIDTARLVTSLKHAIEKWETAREVTSLREGMLSVVPAHPEVFADIVTRDSSMLAIFKYAEAVAPTTLPVLITGETGAGKELIARCIHVASGRSGSFVPVNVAGLDDTLFADTLFGHVRGAYTGADAAREGMVAKAGEGTLFLDEIGDLAPESQIKLLRLLQEREYYPLGTDRPRPASARFVFATNLDTCEGHGRWEAQEGPAVPLEIASHQDPSPARTPLGSSGSPGSFLPEGGEGDRKGPARCSAGAAPAAQELLIPRQHQGAGRDGFRRSRTPPVAHPVTGELPRGNWGALGLFRGCLKRSVRRGRREPVCLLPVSPDAERGESAAHRGGFAPR